MKQDAISFEVNPIPQKNMGQNSFQHKYNCVNAKIRLCMNLTAFDANVKTHELTLINNTLKWEKIKARIKIHIKTLCLGKEFRYQAMSSGKI